MLDNMKPRESLQNCARDMDRRNQHQRAITVELCGGRPTSEAYDCCQQVGDVDSPTRDCEDLADDAQDKCFA
ncbi:hypothetical protein C6T65_25750 [Burkholderia vietnamiensis]|uniref:Uncharacterized protein n=1 Tax=Burkholderia vietnamiensis TaxID=60552 RepID=A0AA45BB79_BURVI|nr:hypothetical protein C6T65_25750 [Burkholderia vietnamiensis]